MMKKTLLLILIPSIAISFTPDPPNVITDPELKASEPVIAYDSTSNKHYLLYSYIPGTGTTTFYTYLYDSNSGIHKRITLPTGESTFGMRDMISHNGVIYCVFNSSISINGTQIDGLYFIESSNAGTTWSQPHYLGNAATSTPRMSIAKVNGNYYIATTWITEELLQQGTNNYRTSYIIAEKAIGTTTWISKNIHTINHTSIPSERPDTMFISNDSALNSGNSNWLIATNVFYNCYYTQLPVGSINSTNNFMEIGYSSTNPTPKERPGVVFDPNAGRNGQYVYMYITPNNESIVYHSKGSLTGNWSAAQSISNTNALNGAWRYEDIDMSYHNGHIYYSYIEKRFPENNGIIVLKGAEAGRNTYNFIKQRVTSTNFLQTHPEYEAGKITFLQSSSQLTLNSPDVVLQVE
ncbi:MAG: hypothetical protein SFY68_03660 [Candidatus Sumerlaeia bacterium]|nr:hypothetical protein [Candidatus Sumerlaeia bacterium]